MSFDFTSKYGRFREGDRGVALRPVSVFDSQNGDREQCRQHCALIVALSVKKSADFAALDCIRRCDRCNIEDIFT
jgi:hypothetical protein